MSRLDRERFDPYDPMCKLLTIAEVMERTGRTKKTIDRWIKDGRLVTIQIDDPPRTVAATGDVLEVEQGMRANLRASRSIGPRRLGESAI